MEAFASIENLQQLKVYQSARELSKLVWEIVSKWNFFAKKTVGNQWVCATDSMSANIAEGYGRFFFNDTIKFYYYTRGSHFESHDWFLKAKERGLLKKEEVEKYLTISNQFPKELNILIKRTRLNAQNFSKTNKPINQ